MFVIGLSLTLGRSVRVPHRPQLNGEERSPAHGVGEHDHHRHLHGLNPRLGHRRHVAGSGGKRERVSFTTSLLLLLLGLQVQVDLECAADAHLAHRHGYDGHQKYHQRRPRHVRFRSPRLNELCPAVVDTRGDLNPGENKQLRDAEDERREPRDAHWQVPARASPLESHHGVTDRLITVNSHHNYHVSGGEHADDLQILDQTTYEVRTDEAVGYVPHQLWTHLEKGDQQVRQAEMGHNTRILDICCFFFHKTRSRPMSELMRKERWRSAARSRFELNARSGVHLRWLPSPKLHCSSSM